MATPGKDTQHSQINFNTGIFPGNRKDIALPTITRSRSSKFSLTDLTSHPLVSFSDPQIQKPPFCDLIDICELELDDDCRPEKYLKIWMMKNFDLEEQFQFVHEYTKSDELTPLIVSDEMRIDVAVVDKDNSSIPLLLLEVDSNNYNDTVAHCAIALIFQLRYIRLYDQKVEEVSGFVFPNKKTKEIISLITVHWDHFFFNIRWKYLKLEETSPKIQEVLNKQSIFSQIIKNNDSKDYFMGLSQKDLTLLQEILPHGSSLEQVESAYSILVRDKCYYYKISPNVLERWALTGLTYLAWERQFPKSQSFSHLVLPTWIFRINTAIPIFQFEAQPHQPLSRDEAKKCLKDFIQQAVTALEELHKLGYAHRDVRLPNFCFSKHCEAMLIDFDRATAIGSTSGFDRSYFHKPPVEKKDTEGLDFKQLGLVINAIVAPESEEEIVNGLEESSDPFLQELIVRGNYEKCLFEEFCEKNVSSHSIQEVIQERI